MFHYHYVAGWLCVHLALTANVLQVLLVFLIVCSVFFQYFPAWTNDNKELVRAAEEDQAGNHGLGHSHLTSPLLVHGNDPSPTRPSEQIEYNYDTYSPVFETGVAGPGAVIVLASSVDKKDSVELSAHSQRNIPLFFGAESAPGDNSCNSEVVWF